MKRDTVAGILLVLAMSASAAAADAGKTPPRELKTASEKLSYAVGMQVGTSLKQFPAKLDLALFVRGLEDSFKQGALLLTPEQAAEVRSEFARTMREKQVHKTEAAARKNKEKGMAFMEQNKKKKGVVTTASGLQYEVLQAGDGPKPKATDRVKVHYRGTLIDGTEFDSSYKRGEPAAFPLNGVIAGWTEGLQLMSVGSKHRLFVPPDLAYGSRGAGKIIGPEATLIFEVELLAIEK